MKTIPQGKKKQDQQE